MYPIWKYGTEEHRNKYLPKLASGEMIGCFGLTEPDHGSNPGGMVTNFKDMGDHYLLNGAKMWISNAPFADIAVVWAKDESGRIHGLIVERGMEGFERGRKLDKMGLKSQDTAELFFNDVRVPVRNLLGEEGKGFHYLTANLAQERLSIAITGAAVARASLHAAVAYVKERKAFGQQIASFQNTKFVLAEVKTEVDIAFAYLNECVRRLNDGELTPAEAAQAKYWCTDLQKTATDRCLQLFGGYGYMLEYPIARFYADARVTSIYGGTNEVMKTIIAKSLGL